MALENKPDISYISKEQAKASATGHFCDGGEACNCVFLDTGGDEFHRIFGLMFSISGKPGARENPVIARTVMDEGDVLQTEILAIQVEKMAFDIAKTPVEMELSVVGDVLDRNIGLGLRHVYQTFSLNQKIALNAAAIKESLVPVPIPELHRQTWKDVILQVKMKLPAALMDEVENELAQAHVKTIRGHVVDTLVKAIINRLRVDNGLKEMELPGFCLCVTRPNTGHNVYAACEIHLYPKFYDNV